MCDELTTIRGGSSALYGGRLPTCRLANLSACRFVGKSESWRVSAAGMRGGRAQDLSTPEKKGVGTPASIFPHEGEKKKGGVPTHSHRTGCREE